MSGNDLIVAAPWILFVVALTVVCILLLSDRPRRPGKGRSTPPHAARARREEQPPALPEMIFT